MRTAAGTDFQALVLAGASNGTGTSAPANYLALTGNTTAPAAGDTTLVGEYAAAGGGLIRALATYAHTAGVASYTLSKTFTMNANDGATATPAKLGVFNAPSVGTLFLETPIPSPPTMVPGDAVACTESVAI